jgi:hypothetical protein
MGDLNKSAGEAQKNWRANEEKSASVFKDWCLQANNMILSRMVNKEDRIEALHELVKHLIVVNGPVQEP